MPEVGLLVNGPVRWYENITYRFNRYKKTWLQQTDGIDPEHRRYFESLIRKRGYFYVFGYVQSPHSNVGYRFKSDKIVSSDERIPPPDETAPPYDYYDTEQGHCGGPNDYRYKVWLRIIDIKEIIPPVERDRFIVESSGKRMINPPRSAHCYVMIPSDLIEDAIEDEREVSPKIEVSSVEKTINRLFRVKDNSKIDKDYKIDENIETDSFELFRRYIIDNLDKLEAGLYFSGRENYVYHLDKDTLFCKDKSGNNVIVGIYDGILDIEVISRILEKLALAQEKVNTVDVRYFVVSRGIDDKAKSIIRMLSNIKFFKINISFNVEEIES